LIYKRVSDVEGIRLTRHGLTYFKPIGVFGIDTPQHSNSGCNSGDVAIDNSFIFYIIMHTRTSDPLMSWRGFPSEGD
jgi:hypothetical protein